ncbi:hypothetical protein [Celeribacter marinus]|uniref:hypothetical protein n=1 Tax=Celeribacter marinus TaxID=1397108 RepID=UPI00316B3BBF
MSDYKDLYGTQCRVPAATSRVVGPWSFTFDGGTLRHVKFKGVEAIRSIAFLVRDRDWGTLSPRFESEVDTRGDDHLHISYTLTFDSGDAQLVVDIIIDVTPDALSMSARATSSGAFETNRAGFTVLHPIEGVAGQAVRVGHSDGTVEAAHFPLLIDPWQPFMDITSLSHNVGDHSVICQFSGDTFEMEDQRQWGDASFKTYNRPLAKPWPYVLNDADTVAQSVVLTLGDAIFARPPTPPVAARPANFPDMALVLTPDDAVQLAGAHGTLATVNPQRLLCHVDMDIGRLDWQFQAFAAVQAALPDMLFDLELILSCKETPAAELANISARMQAAQFAPDSILVCPSVDRQSTPPGSDWPDCPPLTDIHNAAAQTFPDVIRGGGMVSFFPELNRKRPPIDTLGFVSHGLCPIVHAADDVSVMETLEAIAHITRSARAIFGDLPYRIGPATIAMRQNPYGNRTIANPDGARICMTDDDPRHRGAFGAAYVIGLATALAPANICVWTPAAVFGPRGISEMWPIVQALRVLASRAGQPVKHAQITNGRAELCVGEVTIIANLTPHPQGELGPFGWSVGR